MAGQPDPSKSQIVAAGGAAGRPGGGALALQPSCSFLAVPVAPLPEGYDAAREEKEYCRALLPAGLLASVKKRVEAEGYLTPEKVQQLVDQNVKHDYEMHESVSLIDGNLICQIDTLTDRPVFILPRNRVTSRESLLATYPFAQMGVEPEEMFAQQELGVFPERAGRFGQLDNGTADGDVAYVARSLGSDEPWAFSHLKPVEPVRVVKTKVYLAKDGWDDFLTLAKQVRAMMRVRSLRDRAIGYSPGDGAPGETFVRGARALESTDLREERLRKLEAEIDAKTQKLEDLLADFASADFEEPAAPADSAAS